MIEMTKATDVSEISSTASKKTNQAAFYKKLRSRKYKCFLAFTLSLISWFLIIWFGVLTRIALSILEKLDFDFSTMKDQIRSLLRETAEANRMERE